MQKSLYRRENSNRAQDGRNIEDRDEIICPPTDMLFEKNDCSDLTNII